MELRFLISTCYVFRCNGKYECEVPVLNRLFGDPCPAMYKYLEVYYACANSKYPRQSVPISYQLN